VVGHVRVRSDGSTKAKHGDLLVTIVVLKDATDGADSVEILIPLHVQVVKR